MNDCFMDLEGLNVKDEYPNLQSFAVTSDLKKAISPLETKPDLAIS